MNVGLMSWPLIWSCFFASFPLLKSIYLFVVVLGFQHWVWAFSSPSEWGPLFPAVRELLFVVASLVADCGLRGRSAQA